MANKNNSTNQTIALPTAPVADKGRATQYRPRTAGLFARIERCRDSGTDHWEVHSKDGLVRVYGSPGSRQNDPAVIANPESRIWAVPRGRR